MTEGGRKGGAGTVGDGESGSAKKDWETWRGERGWGSSEVSYPT